MSTVSSLQNSVTRIIQNHLIVWLNENITENIDDLQNSVAKLREISNTVKMFPNVSECITFINQIGNQNIFMIFSGVLHQTTMTEMHDLPQLSAIYILCSDTKQYQQWSKIKGIFTDITTICQVLKKDVHECDRNTISMSFAPVLNDGTKENLNQLDKEFMYTQILKEILLKIDFKPEHRAKFIEYCREQFKDNPAQQRHLDKLENEYDDHKPIWWYTSQCFLYSMLNCALRTMDTELIINLGFFLQHLHNDITGLHSEQYSTNNRTESFTVYRGQRLSNANFQQLCQMKGGLLSFNNFLSTSSNRDIAMRFAPDTVNDQQMVGVLFEITVDPSIHSTPFANIRTYTHYPSEEELLFSMHSVFRIGEITTDNGNQQLWQVKLTLTDDQDPQLHALTEYIREETSPDAGAWYQLILLLHDLGQYAQAEKIHGTLLNEVSNELDSSYIYSVMGSIKRAQGQYQEALKFSEISLAIREKTLPSNHSSLATSYCNIGRVHDEMGEYSQALSFHQKAFAIYEKSLPSNHPYLGTSYGNIGRAYDEMGEYSQALSSHEKAIAIYEKSLPSNHPSLATSYSNIALVYDNMGEYSQALSFHEKAIAIDEKSLSSNHPSLAVSYDNIGKVYYHMDQYEKAFSFYERALQIGENSLSSNHPKLAWYYNDIGMVYSKKGDYSNARSFYKRALDIGERSLPAAHPHLKLYKDNFESMNQKL